MTDKTTDTSTDLFIRDAERLADEIETEIGLAGHDLEWLNEIRAATFTIENRLSRVRTATWQAMHAARLVDR